MSRSLHTTAFFLGLAAICWVGIGYIGGSPLALAITLVIGGFYVMGGLELLRFQQATDTLTAAVSALTETPESLGPWLDGLHPSLQNAVRLRIEGERVGLPGPALTPYLAGLLVLLGMLGTFVGMVVTLNGTGTALESASDLLAIRSSLAAPVKGLGLAFGTSLAGVAASAMLGLVSALCRRDRLHTAQLLDSRIATTLRPFSLAHRRDESFRLLQRQAEVMPELADRLTAMMMAMERHNRVLNERLVAGQDSFHGQAESAYAALASAVGASLKESLTESARIAGATIQPVVEATMAGIARETALLHTNVAKAAQHQLDGLTARVETSHADLGRLWNDALDEHRRTSESMTSGLGTSLDRFAESFEQRAGSLVHTVGQAHAQLQDKIASQDQARLASWTLALGAMADSLHGQLQQAGSDAAALHQSVVDALERTAVDLAAQTEAHAKNTIAEVAHLVQVASEAPRAAADVIAELRQKLSDSMAGDNALLEERSRMLGTLATVLDSVNHASTEQRTAIDSLVSTSADLLARAGAQFTDKVEGGAEKMAQVSAQLTGSAAEVGSLGEAFGLAVQIFSQSNDKLGAQLQRIEGALGKSMARSDEQLAYYVAQAREVIELSVMSQKQIVEDLQRLASQRSLAGSDA